MKRWAQKDSKGKRYFYNVNGAKGYMATGWLTDSKNNTRYFNPTSGYMTTKWATIGNKKYYFTEAVVLQDSVFLTDKKNVTRYFTSKCFMAKGWATNKENKKRYFDPNTGAMYKGFKEDRRDTYYFYSKSGVMATGWSKFKKDINIISIRQPVSWLTGTKTIDGRSIHLAAMVSWIPTQAYYYSDKLRTIKNFLANALLPVGRTLYVWGGRAQLVGCDQKGHQSKWKQWYDSNSSSYNYRYLYGSQ